jgi:Arc/MetJ-type ribon-helix-helix transcriptional regulator
VRAVEHRERGRLDHLEPAGPRRPREPVADRGVGEGVDTHRVRGAPGERDGDPEIDRINLRISRSFLDVVDAVWRERGFNSRSEFIRYAMRESANHSEGAGFWKDLAVSEVQFAEDGGLSSDEVKERYGLDGE